ncbi:MAG TPA: LON peptidase substrate-binding domain-containing protein, partial [Azonexus sp.]|nr:LON peptidase substrate-binding domain-containing protein [Azonexus sp.]
MEAKDINQTADQPESATPANDHTGQGGNGSLVIPEDALIIIPMRNAVLFPGMILPFTIGREASVLAAQQAVQTDLPVGILLQRNPDLDAPGPDDLYTVGTVASVMRYVTMPDETHVIVCQGQQRFRVTGFLPGYPFQVASVERIDEVETSDSQIEARFL